MSSPYARPAATAAAAAATPPATLAPLDAPFFLAAGGGAGVDRPPAGAAGVVPDGVFVCSLMMVSLAEGVEQLLL
jgi:hypothetical protein